MRGGERRGRRKEHRQYGGVQQGECLKSQLHTIQWPQRAGGCSAGLAGCYTCVDQNIDDMLSWLAGLSQPGAEAQQQSLQRLLKPGWSSAPPAAVRCGRQGAADHSMATTARPCGSQPGWASPAARRS